MARLFGAVFLAMACIFTVGCVQSGSVSAKDREGMSDQPDTSSVSAAGNSGRIERSEEDASHISQTSHANEEDKVQWFIAGRPEQVKCPLLADESGTVEPDYDSDEYQQWMQQRFGRMDYYSDNAKEMSMFYRNLITELSIDSNLENVVVSPVNIYLVTTALADCTGAETQRELLSMLGAETIEQVNGIAQNVFMANYIDDGLVKSTFANLLCLNRNMSVEKQTLEKLSEEAHIDICVGDPAGQSMNDHYRRWLNDQTGAHLEESVSGESLVEDSRITLASANYLKTSWRTKFLPEKTYKGVFHGASGDEECDMMSAQIPQLYFKGQGYAMTALELESGGKVWIILPDQGKEIHSVLKESEALDILCSNGQVPNVEQARVNIHIPVFDQQSYLDLKELYKKMNVTGLFAEGGDFSILTGSKARIPVSSIRHAAHLSIDENGVEGAAYTTVSELTSIVFLEDVDFNADRPFCAAVTGEDGSVLFWTEIKSIKPGMR